MWVLEFCKKILLTHKILSRSMIITSSKDLTYEIHRTTLSLGCILFVICYARNHKNMALLSIEDFLVFWHIDILNNWHIWYMHDIFRQEKSICSNIFNFGIAYVRTDKSWFSMPSVVSLFSKTDKQRLESREKNTNAWTKNPFDIKN